ncbi:major facilitator superfamily domain-containing protein [Lipomyces oligophaga]|uniref:major facilitator superfamily domain-containing protein n=1 Tax=Lipomyces oligophaga TaxID=45792 RepID=UPI0034CED7A3
MVESLYRPSTHVSIRETTGCASDESLTCQPNEKQTTFSTEEKGFYTKEIHSSADILEEDVGEIVELSSVGSCLPVENYLVDFEGPDDPFNPLNWPFRKRAYTTFAYALCTFGPQTSSSMYGQVSAQIGEQYHVSSLVATLGVSTFLIGVGFGPMFFAPISEVYGRRMGVLVPFFFSGIFAIGCGAADNLQTIMLMRFFQGLFGGAPIANTGGVLGDIWRPQTRAIALVFYSFVVTGGPPIGPVIGAAFGTLGAHGWRWTQYFAGIYALVVFVLAIFTIPETYPPVLLSAKAKKLRIETGNWNYHSKHEELAFTLKEMVTKHFMRPFAMLATPIVTFMSIYGSFVFGILYLGVVAVPITFVTGRGWSQVIAALPTLSIFFGVVLGGLLNIIGSVHYARVLSRRNGEALPEERLQAMKIGSFLMPIGLFIFGWTAKDGIPWIAPVIGLTLLAMGFITVFQGCINYLVDSFPRYAASAIAATTFLRSCSAAGFPIFGRIMFEKLGVDWGASIIAFFAIAMIPIPFAFYTFGARIRARNPYASQVM